MKHIFDEYGDAILQIAVLTLLTLVLSTLTFMGVSGILNVSGKVAEVDENISANYYDLAEMKNYERQASPEVSYNNNAVVNKPQGYYELFNVSDGSLLGKNAGDLIIKEVKDADGNIITNSVTNANSKTFIFRKTGYYTIKLALFGSKYVYKEIGIVVY